MRQSDFQSALWVDKQHMYISQVSFPDCLRNKKRTFNKHQGLIYSAKIPLLGKQPSPCMNMAYFSFPGWSCLYDRWFKQENPIHNFKVTILHK
jgi:hypothetical protein